LTLKIHVSLRPAHEFAADQCVPLLQCRKDDRLDRYRPHPPAHAPGKDPAGCHLSNLYQNADANVAFDSVEDILNFGANAEAANVFPRLGRSERFRRSDWKVKSAEASYGLEASPGVDSPGSGPMHQGMLCLRPPLRCRRRAGFRPFEQKPSASNPPWRSANRDSAGSRVRQSIRSTSGLREKASRGRLWGRNRRMAINVKEEVPLTGHNWAEALQPRRGLPPAVSMMAEADSSLE